MLLLYTLSIANLAAGNIVFNKVQPTCNFSSPASTGCLRGQLCTQEGQCIAEADYPFNPFALIRRVIPLVERAISLRTDGRCGKDFNGATCDATGAFGGCCSKYGYVHVIE